MSSWKYRLATAPVRAMDRLGLVSQPAVPAVYVVERMNWSTKWDGTYLEQEIGKFAPGTLKITERPERHVRTLVHFGSQFQWCVWAEALPASNRYVVTYFHGKPEDGPDMAHHVDEFIRLLPRVERVVTAASITEQRLLGWGIPREKLIRIPIGVDCDLFRPVALDVRSAARARYGIKPDQLVIGSFQKDGVGWGEGSEPKLIKGPDVLLDVIGRVAKERPVFVLLTGPARGYVARGLEHLGIPYAHDYVEDYFELAERYPALDVYLNCSREEGGPKGIIEAMAAGVPVVSTRVGMAPDIIAHGQSGWLADSDDVVSLARWVVDLAPQSEGSARVVAAARSTVTESSWASVARQHYDFVYKPLLDGASERR